MNYAEYSEKDIRYTRIEISILSLLSKNFPFDVRENSPRLYFPNQIPNSMQTKVDTKYLNILTSIDQIFHSIIKKGEKLPFPTFP